MGCCAFINSNNQLANEEIEVFVSNIESNKHLILNTTKEESPISTTEKLPFSLIKSKDNPNGIVVVKMKNKFE